MADLGAIGTLASPPVLWGLPRNARSLNRAANPVRCLLASNQAHTASFQEDDRRLAGHIESAGGAGLAREIRAIHRDTGSLVGMTRSAASTGAFALAVPPFAHLDLHVLAESGDGCDLYLPNRTPVDG